MLEWFEGLARAAEPMAGWLDRYGYAALFFVFVLEGAMLLYFAPSESLVPFAILSPIASSPPEYALVIGIAVAGATIGQVALFVVARRAGREYLLEHRWVRISESTIDRFDGWFERWGPVAIPVSNTLLFTRNMLTVPAGFSDLSLRRFAALSALGTVVFETALAALTLGLLGTV